MDREERYENRQWNDAVRDVKKAYNQISDFDWKVVEGEPTSAARHLRKALGDFESAVTHLAKADVGTSGSAGVDDLNRGVDQLGKSVTALDNGEIDSAQRHYDKAVTDFDKAADILA